MQNDFHDKDGLVKKYCKCDLLVLDDFGIKKVTDYVYSLIYLIINERYLNMLPTIINSNYTLDELSDQLDDTRIIRRIEEDYILINKKLWKKQT
jgi:DNA replication protein DnaC